MGSEGGLHTRVVFCTSSGRKYRRGILSALTARLPMAPSQTRPAGSTIFAVDGELGLRAAAFNLKACI